MSASNNYPGPIVGDIAELYRDRFLSIAVSMA